MTTGLRRQGDEKPREGGSIPCSPVLGGGGTGVCLVSCSGGLSPLTHLGPSPRLRTQTQEAAGGGGLCLKPEVWWAPPPPHPTRPAPTLTHPGSSPSGGRPAAATVPSAAETVPCQAPWAEQASNRLSVRGSVHSIQSPRGSAPWAGMGRRFWHLLLPLPGAPFSQTTGRTGLGAESVGPKDLTSPGRGLNRIISCCAARPARTPHPHSRRAWPGRGPRRGRQPWGPGSPSGGPARP